MQTKVAIQGIKTSWHDISAREYFGEDIELVKCASFKRLCESMVSGEADAGVMAIENTIAGSLLSNYSLLMDYDFKIVGEVYTHIHMHLMAMPGTKIDDLKYVQSHPIAISQCAEYLWKLPHIIVEEKKDTAEVAERIARDQLHHTAAIANQYAADEFGLEVLAKNIETHKENFTRFLILSRDEPTENSHNKASLCFELRHEVGALAGATRIFSENHINLTKIQSVPVIGKPYEYTFHIDFEWTDSIDFDSVLKDLDRYVMHLRVLGKYKKGILNYNGVAV